MSIKIIQSATNNVFADIIMDNQLYESSYNNSRFKTNSLKIKSNRKLIPFHSFEDISKIEINSFDIFLKLYEDKPVAVLVFERYEYTDIKTNFVSKGVKYNFNMLGFIGCYVKDEYRNKGIATELFSEFNSYLNKKTEFKNNTLNMISAEGKSFELAKKNVEFVFVLSNAHNYSFWLSTAKNIVQYHNIK